MSSYLNLYLVPKESKKPLLLDQYSRSSSIYQEFNSTLSPIYIGNGEDYQYETLTLEKIDDVIREVDKKIKDSEKRLATKIEVYNSIDVHSSEEYNNYTESYLEYKEYISDLKETLQELNFIRNIIYTIDLDCADFEEVLMNID